MSDDLINKKEASTLLRKRSQQLVGIYGDLGGACSGAARLIDELPAADRPSGTYTNSESDVEWYTTETTCDLCGEPWMGARNFCPNCGVRMKGASNENDR